MTPFPVFVLDSAVMWVVGQRVIAEYEPELGLGMVVEITGVRFIEVLFPAAEVTRRYTQKGAPLRRLSLGPGQRATSKTGVSFTVIKVREVEGLLLYSTDVGEPPHVWEYELDHLVQDSNPLTQLLSGDWDHPATFDLREAAWELKGRSLAPDVKGLVGARVSLLPHQLYIANRISHREFPRVLLADEVGLGKTIEAGLIFSSLRALGRAARVLILVPDALKHQWLAEMYRRFHEMFTLVDDERGEQEQLSQGSSVFRMNQRIICPLDLLVENPERLQEAGEEAWDLLIIDEAHHLEWKPDAPSEAWEVARWLSVRSRGLLLLTATPERKGSETEFGLLHLVDPERFPKFSEFQAEAQKMHETALLAKEISAENRSPVFLKKLKSFLGKDKELSQAFAAFEKGESPHNLLERLIDRHGTGRVLIRNRRARLKGFPERQLVLHPLKAPKALTEFFHSFVPDSLSDVLTLASGQPKAPGVSRENAKARLQTRAEWLRELVKSLGKEKVLLIASSERTVVELQEWLRVESTLRTAVFHESLEIVERDRQAAWFAQSDGAQILLCSEIGGEGRNFQFAHHLVLFDLPLHPDTLEQRIGRLDRIGQKDRFQIHVPYLEGTPEEVLAQWYEKGLQSFTEPWNGGDVLETLREPLAETAEAYVPKSKSYKKREAALENLISLTKEKVQQIREAQQESVDVLIDLNSFDEAAGKKLASQLHEIDTSPQLRDFMERTFDYFGVESEEFDGKEDVFKISVHSLSFVETFPGLSGHGETLATYSRDLALAREDLTLLTWDHPIAQGALGLVLEEGTGKTTVGTWPNAKLDTPLVLELLYALEVTAPGSLEAERDFPLRTLKLYLAMDGRVIPRPAGLDSEQLRPMSEKALDPVLDKLRERLPAVLEKGNVAVEAEVSRLIEEAVARRQSRLGQENARLKALSKVNPLISAAEIKEHATKMKEGVAAIRAMKPRLEGIRLIFVGR